MDGALRSGGPAGPAPDGGPQTATARDQMSAEFERLVEEAAVAAEDFGIRWRAPEGRFVSLLISGMHMLNSVSLRAERAFAASADNAQKIAEAELNKVREVALAVETAKQHVRASIELSKVEQQAALRQIVADSLPNLMEEIRRAVVIREQSWNRDRARSNIRAAGLWMLGLFLAGFCLSLWLQWADSSIGSRCKSNLVSIEGRTYCLLSEAQVPTDRSQKQP